MDRYVSFKATKGEAMMVHRPNGDIGLAVIVGEKYVELDFTRGLDSHKDLLRLFKTRWERKGPK